MKFSLVAALVVLLAVAHGSEAGSLVKRHTPADVEKINQLIKDLTATLTSAAKEMVEKVKALEVSHTTHTYLEDSKAKIQPLVDKVKAEAAKLKKQIKPFIGNIEDQIEPVIDNFSKQVKKLTDNVLSQGKSLVDTIGKSFMQVKDQARKLLPPK